MSDCYASLTVSRMSLMPTFLQIFVIFMFAIIAGKSSILRTCMHFHACFARKYLYYCLHVDTKNPEL